MNKILILTCGVLMMSSVALGDNTTAETCANGAGTVITGVVTGHKYCMSNQKISWWNSNSWCDAQGRRLFSLEDCTYSSYINPGIRICADLKNISIESEIIVWTATPAGTHQSYGLYLPSGRINPFNRDNSYFAGGKALCY